MKNVKKFLVVLMVLVMLTAMLAACSNAASTASQSAAAPASSSPAVESSAAAGTSASAAASTSASAAATTAGMKFGFSVATLDNPYFIQVANGFKDACKEAGIEAVVNDAKYDATQQYNQFDNYISMGVNAICAAPVDAKSLEAVVTKAQGKNIKVVSEAQGISNADANVIVDDYKYGVLNGENTAKWINEKLGGKAKVLLITLDNVQAVILRGNGMADTIKKECPNATVVGRQMATSMEEAMKVTETVLQAHPDVNVIDCVNDQLALGAYQAVKSMNLKDTTNIFIGGADNTDEMLNKMKEANSLLRCTIDIKPYDTGKNCVQVMMQNVKNGSEKGKNYFFDMKSVWQSDLK